MLVIDAPEGSPNFTAMVDVPNPIDLIDRGQITVNFIFTDGTEMERDFPLDATFPHFANLAVERGDMAAIEILEVRR